jgi:Tfp pilus assembly protein PilF
VISDRGLVGTVERAAAAFERACARLPAQPTMGSGASRLAKQRAKYERTPAGRSKQQSKALIRATEDLAKRVEGRGLALSEEEEIKLTSALLQENDPATAMPLQLSEMVRLTPAAVKKHVKTEKDQQVHLLPGDLAEIIEIDGSRLHVQGPARPELAGRPDAVTDYWYKTSEMERPPPAWSVMGKAEFQMGVGDREHTAAEGRSWEGARGRRRVTVEIDRLTATKSQHYKAPVWSSDRTAVRERAIAEENVDAAHNYMNDGKFAAALDCLERALDYHPDRAMVHATRGACFVFTEQLEDALHEYQQACDRKPDEGAYWNGLGMTNFYMGRALQTQHGETYTGTNPHLLEAEDQLEKAVELGYDRALDDLEFVQETNRTQLEALAQRRSEDPSIAVHEEKERQLRKAQEVVALASREEAEAAAAEAEALREQEEARLAKEGALQEWADVEYAQRLVDAAELELLKVRDHPQARAEAQQRLDRARAKLQEETEEANAAESRAEKERHEADAAEARAKRERTQAEMWHELIHGQGERSEKQQHLADIRDRNTVEHRRERRDRPLDESDAVSESLVRLSAYGIHKLLGAWLPGEEQLDENLKDQRVDIKGQGIGRIIKVEEQTVTKSKHNHKRKQAAPHWTHTVEMEDTLRFPKPIEIQLRSKGNDGMTGAIAFEMHVAGKKGCLQPGDVGKVVMLSSQIPKDPTLRRVRVRGPSVVRYERRSDGTEKKDPRSGHSAFYEQRELERPPLAKMHEEDLPSDVDIHYLKYMKDVEVKERRKHLLRLDNKSLAVEAIKAGAAQSEEKKKRLLNLTKEQLVDMVVDHETGYYTRLGAKSHVVAMSTTGVPTETEPSTSDFEEDPVAIKQGDVNNGVKRVEYEKQDWSVAFQTPGKDLAVAKRIGGGQEQLRKELLALKFHQDETVLRKELERMEPVDLSKRAVAQCSRPPIEVKWINKQCDCKWGTKCQWCENLSKEKLVDVIITNPSTIKRAIAVAIARWKGLDEDELFTNLEAQLTVLQKPDLVDRISSLHHYLASTSTDTEDAERMQKNQLNQLMSAIISHSSVVHRALLQARMQGAIVHPISGEDLGEAGIGALERALISIGDKEKVVERILEREIGPLLTFPTSNWDRRLELAQKEADERALAQARLSDEQLGITRDVGDALNDFFREGMGAAVLNPAKFDIRHSHEHDIQEREQDHGLAREMIEAQYATSEDEVKRLAAKKTEEWKDRLIQLDQEHQANAAKRQFNDATKAMSITEVMKEGREKAAEKARIARQEERRMRQESNKGANATEVYTKRQEELLQTRAEAAQDRKHTKIHEYARKGDLDKMNTDPQLLASHLELPNMFGETPLVCAASEGQSGAVILLLGCRAKVDVTDDDGMTPLMWACASKTPKAVEVLLKEGALVTPVDNAGQNAMEWAACKDLVGSDVSEKRTAMKNENKRRWGVSGKVTEVIERVGADWKSGWAAPTGENWSLSTWLGPAHGTKLAMDPDKAPAKSRTEINKATGMLKHADFTTYRVAKPDFREYPAFGHDSVQVLPSQDVVGRNWDRLNRYDGILTDTKVYEAVMRGEQMEDVLHDIAWHEMTNTLVEGGEAMVSAFVDILMHCRETLGYAISVASFAYEREAMTVLRDRIQDLVRLFSGSAAKRACEIIGMLEERDETVPEKAPTEVEKLELGMDRTARTRKLDTTPL